MPMQSRRRGRERVDIGFAAKGGVGWLRAATGFLPLLLTDIASHTTTVRTATGSGLIGLSNDVAAADAVKIGNGILLFCSSTKKFRKRFSKVMQCFVPICLYSSQRGAVAIFVVLL